MMCLCILQGHFRYDVKEIQITLNKQVMGMLLRGGCDFGHHQGRETPTLRLHYKVTNILTMFRETCFTLIVVD